MDLGGGFSSRNFFKSPLLVSWDGRDAWRPHSVPQSAAVKKTAIFVKVHFCVFGVKMRYRNFKNILESRFPKDDRYHYFEGHRFFTIFSGGAATTAFLKKKLGAMEPWLKKKMENDPIVTEVNDLDVKIVFDGEATYNVMSRFIQELLLVFPGPNAMVYDVSPQVQMVQLFSPDGGDMIDIQVSHNGIWDQYDDGQVAFPETNTEYAMLSTFHNVWIVHTHMKYNVHCVKHHPSDEFNGELCDGNDFSDSDYGYCPKAKKRLGRALYVMAAEKYINKNEFEAFYDKLCDLETSTPSENVKTEKDLGVWTGLINEMKKTIQDNVDKKFLAYITHNGYGFEAMEGVNLRGGAVTKRAMLFLGIATLVVNAFLPY